MLKVIGWNRAFALFFLVLILLGLGSLDQEKLLLNFGSSPPVEVELIAVPEIPVANAVLINPNTNYQAPQASISALAAIVYDRSSQTQLYEENVDRLLNIASLTKLMSAMLIKDALPLDQEIEIKYEDLTYSNKLGLLVGERLTVESLLKAMLIASSNEATEALARNYPGGYYALVNVMNQKAVALGMNHTTFTNPIGYDHLQHLSTAREMVTLSSEFMSDPLFASIVTQSHLVISDVTNQQHHILQNTNSLLMEDARTRGIKTGTTQAAGEALIAQFDHQGHELVIVILGSKNRFTDAKVLLDWTTQNYSWLRPELLMQSLVF